MNNYYSDLRKNTALKSIQREPCPWRNKECICLWALDNYHYIAYCNRSHCIEAKREHINEYVKRHIEGCVERKIIDSGFEI